MPEIPLSDNKAEVSVVLKRLEELVITNRDLTAELEKKTIAAASAGNDPLTGVLSIVRINEISDRFTERDTLPAGVVAADINGLKKINELKGFEAGTKLIIRTAESIRNACNKYDASIFYFGSGHFGIVIRKCSRKILGDLCGAINAIRPGGMAYGSFICTDGKESFEDAYDMAVTRMYRRNLLMEESVRHSIVLSVMGTLQERYDDTNENLNRMIKLSRVVGQTLDFEDHQLDELELACLLHDLGKIAIRETIINKNAKLTKEEKKEIQKHPEIGSRIMRSVPEFRHISDIILSHHEKWDGTGYPGKLKADEIPLISRIIALADAYDSMTSGRPYREPLPVDHVVNEIRACSGTQFDPVVAQIFIDIILSDQKQ